MINLNKTSLEDFNSSEILIENEQNEFEERSKIHEWKQERNDELQRSRFISRSTSVLIREKRNNKTQPINVIPAYQSEFISLEHADIVCPGMENRNAGWKKNLMLAGYEKVLATVTEVWLRENKQEEHACGTSVGGGGGGKWMWWKRGRVVVVVVVAANACITGERIGNRWILLSAAK